MTPTMNLAIIGTGLVSPVGLTPLHHASFLRAGLGLHPASAFVGSDGATVHVFHCPWLGAKRSVAERLGALGVHALREAIEPLKRVPLLKPEDAALFVCVSRPRPGLTDADRQSAVKALTDATMIPLRQVFTGAASFFGALGVAGNFVSTGRVRAAVVVAVDSFVSLEAVRVELNTPPSAWFREPPPLSEAAAAVVLMKGPEARELALSLGTVHYASALKGQGNDDDDDLVDGATLQALFNQVPDLGAPLVRAYGQDEVDRLRHTEWTCASARTTARFDRVVTTACVERWTGRVGSAAGAMQLVYALAAERHHAMQAGAGPFVAWAISRDGTRGLCAATTAGA
jgi:hypothetical protein